MATIKKFESLPEETDDSTKKPPERPPRGVDRSNEGNQKHQAPKPQQKESESDTKPIDPIKYEENEDSKESDKKLPFARAISGTCSGFPRPSKYVTLSLPCAGETCDPLKEFDWICVICMEKFMYGFDKHVYCKCGKTPVHFLEFKCPGEKHGVEFHKHDNINMSEKISRLRPYQDLNILIMGETGVGKSTWINAFMNFLTYESFEEAEKGELCTLIPTQFTQFDHNYQEVLVTTGTDMNEAFEAGQAATQESRVYEFIYDKKTIRLMDTPGIGDPRGIEKDKENFQNILTTLSGLKEIHGICILLKPNNARLSVTFRFCVNELLTYLHRDASKNIVFCFTNTHGTMYKPGDTFPALRTLLNEIKDVKIPLNRDTVYCFDSEAYRFLAAIKNTPKVEFTKADRDNFATSWNISWEETERMMAHILKLIPHPTQSTLNLNHVREVIIKISKPLAEITRNIQTNMSIVEDELRMVKTMKESIEELKKGLTTRRTEIEVRPLDYPRTVCGNSRCVKIWERDGINIIEYVTICHDRCTQTGVQADTVGDARLLKCVKFSRFNLRCKHCNHHYKEHLHIYYDSVQVVKEVKNQAVVESLQQNLSAKEMKQKMIEEKMNLIKEYENELKIIEGASVHFACFLKANAITPFNDAMESYLEHLIKEEEDKVAFGGNKRTLENLRKSKDHYVKEKELLEGQMRQGQGKVPDPEQVDDLVKKLKGLKHSGRKLREVLECISRGWGRMYNEKVVMRPKHKVKGRNIKRMVSLFEMLEKVDVKKTLSNSRGNPNFNG